MDPLLCSSNGKIALVLGTDINNIALGSKRTLHIPYPWDTHFHVGVTKTVVNTRTQRILWSSLRSL